VLRGWQEGREYPLDKDQTSVGRDEHDDVALFRDMRVAKRHVFIQRKGERYLFVNNGAPEQDTLVNDVPTTHPVELHDGDRIQLGNVLLRFQMRAAQNRPRAGRAAPPRPTTPVNTYRQG
jgi:predicted component of type VI protein secretion system